MSKILENLNGPQAEAVTHDQGPLLVFAGAGSGKTRVLTRRIAYLVEEAGVKPGKILAVTFTNKAAREMSQRIETLLPGIKVSWMGTFHSICVRILRRELPELGRLGNFSIMDSSDQLSVVRECIRELNIDDKQYSPRAVQNKISLAKNHMKSVEDFASRAHGTFPKVVAKVYELYQEKLKKNRAMDFDDLLFETVLLFRKHHEILKKYQDRFSHILVDEYQDVNPVQYEFTRLLAEKHRNLCVVGDDDQSIYGFRGADVSIILRFEKDFPGAKVVKLEENYRSTSVVLEAANAIVEKIKGRKKKKLWTKISRGERIGSNACTDGRQEARFVVKEIKKWREKGRTFDDFVILYRTNAQSRSIEEVLKQEGINYRIIGGVRFYDRAEIKDALAYLKLIVNPWDNLSFSRIVNTPSRGIGNITQEKIITRSIEQGADLLNVMKNASELPRIGKKIQDTLASFSSLVVKLRVELDKMAQASKEDDKSHYLGEFIDKVLKKVGYYQMLREDPDPKSAERLDNLEELVNDADEYEKATPGASLEGFLEKVALYSDIDAEVLPAGDEGSLTLMTVHSAKGLEFPIVFIVGLEEGLFPHFRSLEEGSQTALDEERRLFYVAMTRTREKVYLTYARERTIHGKSHNQSPSRFLTEVPEDLIDKYMPEVSKRSFTRKVSSILDKDKPKKRKARDKFSDGEKVCHKIFGTGEVVGSKKGYVTVVFPEHGKKTLSQAFLTPFEGDVQDEENSAVELEPGVAVVSDKGLSGILKKTEGGFAYVILSNGDVEKIPADNLEIKKE